MSETAGSAQAKALPLSSPQEAVHRLAELSAKTQRLLQNNVQNFGTIWSGPLDPTPVWTAFADLSARLSSDPFYLAQAQLSLWQDYVGLWSQMAKRMLGQEVEATVTEARGDRRFKHAAWTDELVFHYLKQSYLIGSRWLQNLVANVKGLDPTTKRTVEFATKQYIDALSPSVGARSWVIRVGSGVADSHTHSSVSPAGKGGEANGSISRRRGGSRDGNSRL